jgi:hypothetical protein
MGSTAYSNHGSIRQYNLQTEHIVSGDAVFEATGAPGIGGDISAEGRFLEAGRIGGIKEVSMFCGGSEFGGDDSGLDYSQPVSRGDFQNAVHFDEGENETAFYGHTSTDITTTAPACGYRNSMAVTER